MFMFPVTIRLSIFKFLKTQLSRRRWFILRRGGVSKKLAAAFGGGVHHWKTRT
jgi:hypothetical protein